MDVRVILSLFVALALLAARRGYDSRERLASRLVERWGRVSEQTLRQVDDRLRIVLDLV